MSMTDFTSDPPTISFTDHEMREMLSLLKPRAETGEGGNHVCVYSLPELRQFTLDLMHYVDISYQRRLDAPPLSLTDDEKRLHYPFAFMLACVAGNAFRTGQLNPVFENPDGPPSPETISAYTEDAVRIIRANSGDNAEVAAMIRKAAE
jgi:hypothetical protein